MKALLIPAHGPPREADLPSGAGTRFMRSLRKLIGTDCAERIWITDRWEAWLDEDGAAAGKPVNQAATLLAQSFGFRPNLLGTVVIIGLDKEPDRPVSLSPAQIDVILQRISAPATRHALPARRCSTDARVRIPGLAPGSGRHPARGHDSRVHHWWTRCPWTDPARNARQLPPLHVSCNGGNVGGVLPVTSQAEAGCVLQVLPHAIAKLRDTAVLAAPSNRTGIYAPSLDTAASVLFTTIASGDVAVHLGEFGPDDDCHFGRAYAGWHQEKSLALPVAQRRDCWRGAWNDMSLSTGLGFVGHTAVATVSGFIVDVAGVTGASICPCGCNGVVFDLQDPSPEAAARYRGRRVAVPPRGKKWT